MSETKPETPRTKEVAKMWAEGIDCHHDGRVFCEFAKTPELETQQLQKECHLLKLDSDRWRKTAEENHNQNQQLQHNIASHTTLRNAAEEALRVMSIAARGYSGDPIELHNAITNLRNAL